MGDLDLALKAAGEAAYRWIVETDEIIWSPNVAEVLGCPSSFVSTGKRFASLLDVENVTTRYETVMNSKARDDGRGVPFQIEYMFKSQGRNNPVSVWIEDAGRWQAGLDGNPKVVFGTVRRVDERHRREQHLNFMGNCDPQTGMMNRGRMTEALGEAIAVATKASTQCAFAIAAISNLALVNEAYGFEIADEVIVAVGRKLRQVMRGGDGIARYSGGKFGIILNDCKEEELEIALSRYLEAIRDSVIETGRGPVWATLSIGAVTLPKYAATASSATSFAEEALSEAQKLPADGYIIFRPSERRNAEREINSRCATEIVTCLKEERFKLAFQPIVDTKTGKTAYHEALLRMRDQETGELITASHLIPVAERLGIVRLVDRAVLQLIMQTLQQQPDAMLTMNISGTTATDPHWYDQILDAMRAEPKMAERLTVEITETVALSHLASTRRFVETLREAGCGVAIDDFGSGYTSFRSLRELPVTMLKFDGSFCTNLRENPDNEYMVRSLIDLSHRFNLKSVAEWVDRKDDVEALTEWGVDYLQGHFVSEATLTPSWASAVRPAAQEPFIIRPARAVGPEIVVAAPPVTTAFDFSETAEEEIEIAPLLDVAPTAFAATPEPTPMVALPVLAPEPEITLEAPAAPALDETMLDFSALDDSIEKLRDALRGLEFSAAAPVADASRDEEDSDQHAA
ncbi:GGDEF and EAL domain-containing protein [Aestuariivirga litoralis]|uniref:GGDEF and EAL domain-containing protein n=1 Tax=Aestuariivirga litoralis TaxID=2650924 RepID=UPI0018C6CAFA|nr:GGDEF and EAL domain-containing protein [Aestuariivirga litoralis]MBG1233652.1 GGDEF and EAL domain-containing protein [Aestuariivirga litoralis]